MAMSELGGAQRRLPDFLGKYCSSSWILPSRSRVKTGSMSPSLHLKPTPVNRTAASA